MSNFSYMTLVHAGHGKSLEELFDGKHREIGDGFQNNDRLAAAINVGGSNSDG